jgi:signal transduction histidine kinase
MADRPDEREAEPLTRDGRVAGKRAGWIAGEQAALRRVAVLVARGAPEEVFAAVAAEVGRVLEVDFTYLGRYEPDGAATALAAWAMTGAASRVRVGDRLELGGRNVTTLVFQTRRPTRIDDYANASGRVSAAVLAQGLHSAVGVPVSVAGRLWGVMVVASTRAVPLPAGTEARLAGFTELAATAIANAQARVELRSYADEQAALRRVATLVAQGAPPEEVFAAVAEEVRQLVDAVDTAVMRYDPDGAVTILGTSTSSGPALPLRRWALGGRNVTTLVSQTQRPARIDDYADASGPAADLMRGSDTRSVVGVPVSVEGRLWGVMVVASKGAPLPAGTEARLAGFTELAATAIANAEARSALTASRARIVATADATRRRIERDLHDGVQQRLVSLFLHLQAVQAAPPGTSELARRLDSAVTLVDGVLEELREIARGLHPAILADSGLRPALETLARRSAVPVCLDVPVDGRLPEPVEIAAYYTVSEALTNTAKHAHASAIDVQVETGDGALHIHVHDDGRGGADFGHGSGLVGLKDRIEALGGRFLLRSPPGAGTTVQIALPLDDP